MDSCCWWYNWTQLPSSIFKFNFQDSSFFSRAQPSNRGSSPLLLLWAARHNHHHLPLKPNNQISHEAFGFFKFEVREITEKIERERSGFSLLELPPSKHNCGAPPPLSCSPASSEPISSPMSPSDAGTVPTQIKSVTAHQNWLGDYGTTCMNDLRNGKRVKLRSRSRCLHIWIWNRETKTRAMIPRLKQ